MKIRPANTRGYLNAGWIESRRTFSNNSYWDPRYINFSDLEVINDDILQPGHAVPKHEHRNMDILGYVVTGPCTHWDSLGNETVCESGTVQCMSSGKSIWHTEGNNSDHPIRYLQLWIKPKLLNTRPEYTSKIFTRIDKLDNFCLIASPNGPIEILQDTRGYAGIFTRPHIYILDQQRKYYLYTVSGRAVVNNVEISEGDGISFEEDSSIEIDRPEEFEILLFDLR